MTTLFIVQIRTQNERENESSRDWMHDARSFQGYPTLDAAIAAGRTAIQEEIDGLDPEDCPDGFPTITEWNTLDYKDGAWFEITHKDGTEYDSGRVLVHTVETEDGPQ